MKTCKKCGQEKPMSDFYSHPEMKDGKLNHCISCIKVYQRIRRLTNPAVQERDRLRSKTPKRKQHLLAVAKQWRKNHPLAYKAQTAVGNAIRDGKLKKFPCVICGTTKNIHAHHKNYARPLDVLWLCAKCHHRLHIAIPEMGGHFHQIGNHHV